MFEPDDDFVFSADPTSRGDEVAEYCRDWYEQNRETWWARHKPYGAAPDRAGVHADNFMLAFVDYVGRVLAAAAASQDGEKQ